jgi:hypothetical protein
MAPLDLRVGGALVLLFGMLPTRLARLVRQLRDQDEPRWTHGRLGTPVPWLFPGQSPARPAVEILFGVRLHQYGINASAGHNAARLALAAELPAQSSLT